MSRPLDNVNPTIFDTPVASSSRRRPVSARALLWENEDVDSYGSSEEEREEIDAEEIYGEL